MLWGGTLPKYVETPPKKKQKNLQVINFFFILKVISLGYWKRNSTPTFTMGNHIYCFKDVELTYSNVEFKKVSGGVTLTPALGEESVRAPDFSCQRAPI